MLLGNLPLTNPRGRYHAKKGTDRRLGSHEIEPIVSSRQAQQVRLFWAQKARKLHGPTNQTISLYRRVRGLFRRCILLPGKKNIDVFIFLIGY